MKINNNFNIRDPREKTNLNSDAWKVHRPGAWNGAS